MILRKAVSILLVLIVASLLSADNALAKGQKKPDAQPRTSPSFSELDKDMDGRLTLAEFTAGFPNEADVEKKFKSLDTNGDGALSISEYKVGYPDPIPPKKSAKKPAKKDAKKAAAKGKPAAGKQFAQLDTNQDGKLSLEEYKSGMPNEPNPEQKFKSLDKDGDGFLSPAEFSAGIAKPAKKK